MRQSCNLSSNLNPMIPLPTKGQSTNLLKFIAQLQGQIVQLQEQVVRLRELNVQQQARIEVLENEIIRLKKLNPKPNIKPSTKPPDDNDPDGSPPSSDGNAETEAPEDGESYSRKSEVERPDDTTRRQRSQPDSPPVSEEHCLSPDDIPEGSVRHGRESFTVQEFEIKAKSVRYWLEQWLTPEGKTISGRPPDSLHGHHFGSQLQAFILLQHYGCAVTQPQLLELLWDAGVSISAGELSNLLTKGHDDFHTEKDELLATGIRCSHYLQTDDTGARHKGQNGYCTVVVNELFTWFGTTGSKSRENFLTLLHRPWPVYVLNRHGLDYLEKHGLSKKWLRLLEQYSEVHFLSLKAWEDFMDDIGFKERPGLRRSISEGMLYGSLMHHGFDRHMVTFSDGASPDIS
ncbi:transposase [Endozoicomonas montiporae]|nr:transposase [Endozoicomonas montiporae]